MRRVEASVAVALATSLALFQSACVLTGKPKTSTAAAPPPPKPAVVKPAAPPESLSVPQTQVQLPPPQPVNLEALAPRAQAGSSRAAVPASAASGSPRPRRRNRSRKRPCPPHPRPRPPMPELAPVQEIVPADERKRYQESADARKTEIRQLLTQIKSHHPTAEAESRGQTHPIVRRAIGRRGKARRHAPGRCPGRARARPRQELTGGK